jgi:pyruvate dehydrogenase E1 component alpha subunit
MRQATQQAVERARKTGVPFFLEAKTYRFRGHSMADPAKYRTREEVDRWKARDPIALLGGRIEGLGIAAAGRLAEIDGAVKAEVQERWRPEASPGRRPTRSPGRLCRRLSRGCSPC